ncbi:hypothetical protein [Marivirga sp.]|uniref:hypothetical protein n=1 Tax=Marivirga sp. TaxID=2018662 RepID=UPI003DA76139
MYQKGLDLWFNLGIKILLLQLVIKETNKMIKIIRLTFVLIFASFAWLSQVKGQCISTEDFEIEIIEGKELVVSFPNYKDSVTDIEFSLYNYTNASIYKTISLGSGNIQDVVFNKSLQRLIFENIPTGDYLLIVKKPSCKDVHVGKDFSGFPYSGLRID